MPGGLVKLRFSVVIRREGYYGLFFRENFSNCLFKVKVVPGNLSIDDSVFLLPEKLKTDYQFQSAHNDCIERSEIVCVKSKTLKKAKSALNTVTDENSLKFGEDCVVYSCFDPDLQGSVSQDSKRLEFSMWRKPYSKILQMSVRKISDDFEKESH